MSLKFVERPEIKDDFVSVLSYLSLKASLVQFCLNVFTNDIIESSYVIS